MRLEFMLQTRKQSTFVLLKPFDTSGLHVDAPYACLVYATEPVTGEEMAEISEWLISSGCKYAVCGGTDCSQWHDAIDMADIEKDPSFAHTIMTSWHAEETVEDIVWFWLNLTNYDDFVFENYIALIIGQPGDLERRIARAANENQL